MNTAPSRTSSPGESGPLPLAILGALGVVYGDIGTSPLYAFRACFSTFGLSPTADNVLGILSLMFWAFTILVSVKYVMLLLRADLRGEGGVLALMTLATQGPSKRRSSFVIATTLGLLGAGLLFGDGMLTPAVSVLSSIEGLEVASPRMSRFIVPITIGVLLVVFGAQRFGTAKIGLAYGPIMFVWFACIAGMGVYWILRDPSILRAADPRYALRFLEAGGLGAFRAMGGVFLVLTGAEALYADMGHFGRRPIRAGWFGFVLPALLLNYFGQGALVLERGKEVVHPFFDMGPSWTIYPLVGLATLATVIASQAVISGVFSLTYQAQQLGFLPHLATKHYAAERRGQVYIPFVNWALFVATSFLAISFRSSQALAGAYGIAVSCTMVLTSLLAFVYVRRNLGWSFVVASAVVVVFLSMELLFFGANMTRFIDGGWIPILVGLIVFFAMATWRRGRVLLHEKRKAAMVDVDTLVQRVKERQPYRPKGTAVFVSKDPTGIPATLMQNLERNNVLHQQVILATIVIEEVPRVPSSDRLTLEELPLNITRVVGHYGFIQTPNLPVLLDEARQSGREMQLEDATYFISRGTLVITPAKGMPVWRKRFFEFLFRSERDPTQRFQLPTKRVIELGDQITL
ncbi:MAG: KUP/HAK/KT family potassium transporter [Myxococcota bacterium]